MKLLIATFGKSPGIITEVIDVLLNKKINVDKVILISTKDSDVKEGAEFIKKHIHQYNVYQGAISVNVKIIEDYEDITTDESIDQFIKVTKEIFEFHQKDEIYVCISGGRKNMSILLALLSQIYKAEMLFHVIPPKDIEKKWDELRALQNYPDEMKKYLHPEISQLKFVPLPLDPIISSWMQEKIADEFFNQSNYTAASRIYGLLKEEFSDPRRVEIKELLSLAYLNWDSLKFEEAKEKLDKALKKINQYNNFLINRIDLLQKQCSILSILNKNKEFIENIKDKEYFKNISLSLFSKAQRYAENQIYDHAILCLYRILEFISQHRLALKGIDTKKVEESIRNNYKEKFANLKKEITKASSEIPKRIGLLDGWILLVAMRDGLFENKDDEAILKELKELYGKSGIRNSLWIIHGYEIGVREKFSTLKEYVKKWLEKLIKNIDDELKNFEFLKYS